MSRSYIDFTSAYSSKEKKLSYMHATRNHSAEVILIFPVAAQPYFRIQLSPELIDDQPALKKLFSENILKYMVPVLLPQSASTPIIVNLNDETSSEEEKSVAKNNSTIMELRDVRGVENMIHHLLDSYDHEKSAHGSADLLCAKRQIRSDVIKRESADYYRETLITMLRDMIINISKLSDKNKLYEDEAFISLHDALRQRYDTLISINRNPLLHQNWIEKYSGDKNISAGLLVNELLNLVHQSSIKTAHKYIISPALQALEAKRKGMIDAAQQLEKNPKLDKSIRNKIAGYRTELTKDLSPTILLTHMNKLKQFCLRKNIKSKIKINSFFNRIFYRFFKIAKSDYRGFGGPGHKLIFFSKASHLDNINKLVPPQKRRKL